MKDIDAAAPSGPDRPRVGLVGFAELRREGMTAILCAEHHQDRYELLALDAAAALRMLDLELVLLDADGAGSLLELLTAFRQARPQLRVLVVGAPVDHSQIARIISAGAKGYLEDRSSPADICMALEVVRDGSIWAPRKVLSHLLDHAFDSAQEARREAEPEPVRFTAREREVLRLLVLGYPNREIAALMKVDDGTVKAHLSRLMRKAGVENRIALTMRAIEKHWT